MCFWKKNILSKKEVCSDCGIETSNRTRCDICDWICDKRCLYNKNDAKFIKMIQDIQLIYENDREAKRKAYINLKEKYEKYSEKLKIKNMKYAHNRLKKLGLI